MRIGWRRRSGFGANQTSAPGWAAGTGKRRPPSRRVNLYLLCATYNGNVNIVNCGSVPVDGGWCGGVDACTGKYSASLGVPEELPHRYFLFGRSTHSTQATEGVWTVRDQ